MRELAHLRIILRCFFFLFVFCVCHEAETPETNQMRWCCCILCCLLESRARGNLISGRNEKVWKEKLGKISTNLFFLLVSVDSKSFQKASNVWIFALSSFLPTHDLNYYDSHHHYSLSKRRRIFKWFSRMLILATLWASRGNEQKRQK